MARIDHLAFRVADRDATVKFFMDAFGYKFQNEFEIFFNDEKTDKALCVALEPPEKTWKEMPFWVGVPDAPVESIYHLAPEIFVSQGTPGSIVYNWVQKRDGVGGLHHLAYQVPSVDGKMKEWMEKGYGDFTSEKPFKCDGLTQVFTKPSSLTGVVYEFIERSEVGFCKDNVKDLMRSSVELDKNIP